MENAQERLIRYLRDAHAAEVGSRKILEGFADDANDPSIKSLYREHIAITRTQESRLEQCLGKYGADPSDAKGFFNTVMAKMSEMLHGAHDEYDRTTQNLIKAHALEHMECGMYEALAAYAKSLGDLDVMKVAETIQSEEKQAAEMIWPYIAQSAGAPIMSQTGGQAYPA